MKPLVGLNVDEDDFDRVLNEESQKIHVTINDEKDLDRALASSSILRITLPGDSDRHRLMAMVERTPPADMLQP